MQNKIHKVPSALLVKVYVIFPPYSKHIYYNSTELILMNYKKFQLGLK